MDYVQTANFWGFIVTLTTSCVLQSHVHGDERCSEDERQYCYKCHAGKISWWSQDQEGVSCSNNEEVSNCQLNGQGRE